MKFPFLPAAFLLLFVGIVFGGCSSSPSSPVSITPVAYTNLSQLALSQAELPFTIHGEQTKTPNMKDPTLSQYGAIRGYTRYVINEKTESATSIQLGQTIVEYPPGNASLAFAAFVNQSRNADQSQYKLTWLLDPGIGETSCAFIVTDKSGNQEPIAMIVFVKSNIMESVILIAPSTDIDTLTRAAKVAAEKIPS